MPDPRPPSWDDADIVMVSALEHWSYCPRQFALIHVDQVWDENLYTLRGRHAHEKVDVPEAELRDGVRVERLPCRSGPTASASSARRTSLSITMPSPTPSNTSTAAGAAANTTTCSSAPRPSAWKR